MVQFWLLLITEHKVGLAVMYFFALACSDSENQKCKMAKLLARFLNHFNSWQSLVVELRMLALSCQCSTIKLQQTYWTTTSPKNSLYYVLDHSALFMGRSFWTFCKVFLMAHTEWASDVQLKHSLLLTTVKIKVWCEVLLTEIEWRQV